MTWLEIDIPHFDVILVTNAEERQSLSNTAGTSCDKQFKRFSTSLKRRKIESLVDNFSSDEFT